MFTIKTLTKDDLGLLMNVADDVFDNPVDETFAREFLNDPRHHIVVAISEGVIVAEGTAAEIRHSELPYVHQFVHGEADGPVPFHYPAPPYADDLRLGGQGA